MNTLKINIQKLLHKKTGFTLIELLVTISIIAVLLTVGSAAYTRANSKARDGKRQSDLEQIRSALELYRTDNGSYPNTGAPNYTDVANLGVLSPDYIKTLPTDPKGVVYMYKAMLAAGSPTKYYGYCLSAKLDSAPGGTWTAPCTLYATYNYSVANP
jgi:type II secretion system protein G